MRTRLNSKALSEARTLAAATGKRVEVWDTILAGLHLRVTPTGAASFWLKYRAAGVQRKYKIGSGTMAVDEARREARKIQTAADKGADPQADRKANRESLRMIDLLGETGPMLQTKGGKPRLPPTDKNPGWYLGTYCKTAGTNNTGKSEATISADRYRIYKHLRSRKGFANKRVDAVTVADLQAIQADVPAGTWRKLRDILRVCFAHAEETGVIEKNPAARLKATADKKVERYLSPEERKRLDGALALALKLGPRTEGGLATGYVRLFRLLSLTGCRLGEILTLRWENIDFRHGQMLVTGKTGDRTVPLTSQAQAFLKAERGNVKRIGLVCPNTDGKALSNVQRAWRLLRKHAEITNLRIHDLRHSWASDAVSAGVPLHVIGAVLGHKSAQTTARYAHLHNAAIQDGLAKAGAAIEAATKG